ncbi:DUF4302 domain-containing protein [Tenacibaculum sp. M341]|uniref:DUF4302 domain-containing protein n=1 Tax=Tenacibaculum sp. M341 TaxID=2530339 RepID=UPI00104D15E6|nr:DUF4302 domain-containing protein [Tenacibaculum sp. M341]TCI85914.1 DUF4302 domain-containing protein [Tenacibaculum sp. M341]
MKNSIQKYIPFILLCMLFISCNDENEGLFDTSAAERLDKNITEVQNKLISSDNGWVFEYFPHREQNIGGYNFIVKFDDKNNVEAYSETQTDFSTPVSSLYDVIARGGSLLTFHENNSLLHEFSTPSPSEYQAKGGDYEFIVSIVDDNTLKAKGAVTGNNLFLRKLTTTPQEYLTKVSQISNNILGKKLFLKIDSGYANLAFSNRNITITKGLIGNTEDITIPIVFTTTGVRFYSPIMINGVEVSELTFDSNKLINESASVTIEVVDTPIDMSISWVTAARPGFMPQEFIDVFAVAKAAHDPNFGGAFPLSDIFNIGNSSITFRIGGAIASHGLDFSGVPGEPLQMSITKANPGTNWRFVPSFEPMVDIFIDNSPYNVDITDPTAPILTSVANPTFAFVLQ